MNGDTPHNATHRDRVRQRHTVIGSFLKRNFIHSVEVRLACHMRRNELRLIHMDTLDLRSSQRQVPAEDEEQVLSALDLTQVNGALTVNRALQFRQHRGRTVIRMPRDSHRIAAEAFNLIVMIPSLHIDQRSRTHGVQIYCVKNLGRCCHKGPPPYGVQLRGHRAGSV